ncbi:Threonine/homoserine efflux transporter RhtA [Flavobacterium flevense]|uniref:Permease n=1 Tax=Flavobacterium flevense TaxID=983 RepID=A0A4Y4AWE6_9FLAO|nr:DMT family transporter [Flavobacterium flevense]GEC71669.1 permease [Flavobacterium flevense]SHL27407.1 Threonine/homoserine efflux transporter RhtA [Flavobacterium flevense]
MIKNKTLKGVVLVALGASSYGMLATFVKIAYQQGYTTAEVSGSQFSLGLLGVFFLTLLRKIKKDTNEIKISRKQISQLILAGTSMGFTSVFYYLSVRYVPVSIGIVLLMQTVWMGVLTEMLLDRKKPSLQKIISVVITLIGTVLATNLLSSKLTLDWRGFFWGILAAAAFTTTMFSANRIATEISSLKRSLFMLIGGTVIVVIFALITQNTPFNFSIFAKWGIILALFGTIIPPLLLTSGFPLTGIGLGSIVSALELPVSVAMAYFLLSEKVNALQWFGIFLIIMAIVLMNIRLKKSQ